MAMARIAIRRFKFAIFLSSLTFLMFLWVIRKNSTAVISNDDNKNTKSEYVVVKVKNIVHNDKSPAHIKNEHKNNGNQGVIDVKNEFEEIRSKIKKMMKVSYESYRKYCKDENELKPLSKFCQSGVFPSNLGLSSVDSLDTLYIMGLTDEFNQALEWIKDLNFQKAGQVSVFETNIRYVGGLLSCYYLTKNQICLEKADEIASLIISACSALNGICYSLINTNTGYKFNYNGNFILAEFGTLHLEFMSLYKLTNKEIYKTVSYGIRNNIKRVMKRNNLLSYLFDSNGNDIGGLYSMGAMADSFYEYLIKSYVITQHRDIEGLELFSKLVAAIEERLMDNVNGHLYFGTRTKRPSTMEHLACFSGGMYALASKHVTDPILNKHYMQLAMNLTETCYLAYNSTKTGIGSEIFDASNMKPVQSNHLLRPETIESIFYLWRTTHDIKYREWAEQIFRSIEKYCYIENGGFSGLRDVNIIDKSGNNLDDVQQSYFLAESMKYLYLIFSDDDVVSIDEWVFNTEAHPFPVGSYD